MCSRCQPSSAVSSWKAWVPEPASRTRGRSKVAMLGLAWATSALASPPATGSQQPDKYYGRSSALPAPKGGEVSVVSAGAGPSDDDQSA
jgi:hypothetical protein